MDDEQKVSFAWALTLFDSLFSILLSLMRMTFPYHFDFCPVLSLKVANGKGKIIEVLPPKGKLLKIYEFGEEQKFDYHQVYTDGQYVYDPRLSSDPIPKGDWQIMIRSLNPDAVFK
jgi:hypothetical protein